MIVLDTHALVWWVSGNEKLSPKALEAIEEALGPDGSGVLVSSISAWEIAMLVANERIILSMLVEDWLKTVEAIEGVRIVPVDMNIAVESNRLPGTFHKDPVDRMIVALARRFNADLITSDKKITAYRHVKTIW